MLCTTRLVAQLIGEEPWLVSGQKTVVFTVKLPSFFTPKTPFRQSKFEAVLRGPFSGGGADEEMFSLIFSTHQTP